MTANRNRVDMDALHAEIRKIAEAWKGVNGGIYAINGMCLEIAHAFAPRLTAPKPAECPSCGGTTSHTSGCQAEGNSARS
jgi:hypothetical protein